MKNQTQKTASAKPKARRKSETLTITNDAALALNQLVTRFHSGEQAPRDADSMARLRRAPGSRLILLAGADADAKPIATTIQAGRILQPGGSARQYSENRAQLSHYRIR